MNFVKALFLWSILWMAVLLTASKYKHSAKWLSLIHGVIATLIASATILAETFDDQFCTACSIGFFLIDSLDMIRRDLKGTNKSTQSNLRFLEYVHHFISILFGTYLTLNQTAICKDDCPISNLFVYAQTNEFSTPFYNIYLMNGDTIWGIIFVITFFACRIVFNLLTIVPVSFKNCSTASFMVIMVSYQTLQCFWFGAMLLKLLEFLK
mmetsp:Transcript_9163/g.13758  ORF Transcript_9163/g.13758 Transcript_9163/m.13758 type:complete len:209 (+) Transcript_9163:81-707(+)